MRLQRRVENAQAGSNSPRPSIAQGFICTSLVWPWLESLFKVVPSDHTICGHKSPTSKMANRINATTPQLEFLDRVFEAFTSRDTNNFRPFLSRNFSYKSFPKIPELPDETKDEFIETFGPLFAPLTKLEVRVRHQEAAFDLEADIHHL